jgi:hypothetical protein
MAAQWRPAVHQINLDLFTRLYGRDLGFLEIARYPVGVAVDQRHDLIADRGVLTDFEGQVGDKPVHRRAQDGAVEVELGRRAVRQRLLVRGGSRVGSQHGVLPRLNGDR